MTVESASYISQLDTTLPTAADIISEGDDHLRLVKTALKTQFPNFGTTAISASAAEVNYSVGVTSAIQTQLNSKAPTASPTFTGTAVLPATTSIGTVSDVEIATLDGVTSSIQTQINGKGAITGQAWTGAHSFAGDTSVPTLAAGSNTTGAASTAFVQADFLQKFPNYTEPVAASTAELNHLVGVTSAIQPQLSNQVSGPIHAATSKTTPVDADELGITDSAASWGLKKLTFANLKAWISSLGGAGISNTPSGNISATNVQAAINELAEIKVDLAAATGASLVGFQQEGAGAVARTAEGKLREVVSVKDFGAVGDGVTDDTAAINAASAAANGNGEVVFPNGSYNFAFSKPPYGVTWKFDGTDITRQELGGSGTAVRFFRPKLTYIDGPHELNQVQVEHDRVIAKGSNAIGAQYADYAYGNTIEKENWSETSGVPVAGEINNITLFHRNGCVTGDPVKTGGAGILANLGQTAGSGYTQLLEAVNSVFTKGTLAVQKQTNMQLLGIDEKTGESYGAVFNSFEGTQTCAIRVNSTTTSGWARLLDSYIGAVNSFFLDVSGRLRWRVNGTSMSLSQDSTTSATVFRNEAGRALLYATPTGYAGLRTVNVQSGTTYTILTDELSGDLGKTVVLANAAAITVTLPNNAPVGFHFEAIQRDPGQVTFVPASGATLHNVNAHTKTQGQYAVVRLCVRGNTGGTGAFWVMDGATAA